MKIAVTGALGYSGRYITERLLAEGHEVLTLTNSPQRPNPFGNRLRISPFLFQEPAELAAALRGVHTLINTYWVRFDHRRFTHDEAVANTRALFHAARRAGVRRIVHVSITNPDAQSTLPYFRGKAELETELRELGVSYCILRPAVLFGREDVLINNIAWALRHLPLVGVFGRGEYRLQPIHVDDLAASAVAQAGLEANCVVEAIGPETFTYLELVNRIREVVGSRARVVCVPPWVGYWSCRMLGWLVRDVILTREEIQGLMENRLCVDPPPLGATRLTEWMMEHRKHLGVHYTSEMARRVDRVSAYRSN